MARGHGEVRLNAGAFTERTRGRGSASGGAKMHFDSVPDDPSYKNFCRWNNFWRDRNGSDTDAGTFAPAYNELYKILTGASVTPICGESPEGYEPWEPLGPLRTPLNENSANGMGIVTKVLVDHRDPDGQTFYAGTNASGLWKTENGLAPANDVIWAPALADNRIPALGIHDLTITGKGYIFAATGYEARYNNMYGLGLVVDKGNGWEATPLTISPSDLKRTLSLDSYNFNDPSKDDYILASLPNEIHISKDEGETFEKVFEFNQTDPSHNSRRPIDDLAFHLTDPNIFYATLGDVNNIYSGAEILRFEYNVVDQVYSVMSFDASDFNIPSGDFFPRIDITTVPSDPDKLYALASVVEPAQGLHLLSSVDAGLTWTNLNYTEGGGAGRLINEFGIGALTENFFMKAGIDPWSTNIETAPFTVLEDAGANGSGIHDDTRDFEITLVPNPANPNEMIEMILIGHDGGVGRSFDLGATFEDISNGLNIAQFYGFDVAADNSFLVGGCQDLGLLWYKDDEWRILQRLGDGFGAAIDPIEGKYVFTHRQDDVFYESDPSPNPFVFPGNFNETNPNPSGPAANIFADFGFSMPMNFHQDGTLYLGAQGLFKRDRSNTWSQVGNPSWRFRSFAVSRNSDIIYAARSELWWGNDGVNDGNLGEQGFWKTRNANDANPVWDNISANCAPLQFSWVNDIVVDPDRPERVWVTLARFSEGNKVFFSGDGGDNWVNISTGLPNFPVNCIVREEGTNNGLFVGTDVGVFYNANGASPNSEWKCLNESLPTCIIMDLKINYCENKLYAGTHGRGIWVMDLPKIKNNKPIAITENTTWPTGSISTLNSDLVVESGNTLTIQGTVYIANRKKIIVEPGATLYLEGGRLTNICKAPWAGIHVVGNKNKEQGTSNSNGNYENQGYFVSLGGTIENATTAIRLWHPDQNDNIYDYNTSGGIVQAWYTNFINNARDVEFINYTNTDSNTGQAVGNQSYFLGCNFRLNDDYFEANTSMPIARITMWAVDGIGIWGCNFENTDLPFNISARGIYSLDANFSVDASGFFPSQFKGFSTGIEALNNYDLHNYTVRNTRFRENGIGVNNNGVNSPLIKNCNFSLGSTNLLASRNYGIILNGGTGYIIEENTLEAAEGLSTSSVKVGIVARATGNEWNSIYKNNFSRLDFANLSNGDNTGGADAGLKYECNQNSQNRFDFSVPQGNGAFGISEVQSGPFDVINDDNLPAGNVFTSELFFPLVSQFANMGEELDYIANGDSPAEVLNLNLTTGISQSQIFNNTNLCEAHMFTDGDPQLTDIEKESVKGEFYYHLNILNDLKEGIDGKGTANVVSSESLAEISGHANKVYKAANILVYDLLSDSTKTELDSLRTWWANKNSLDADYNIINSYSAEKDTNIAKQLTLAITTNRTLSTRQELDYNNFKTIQNLEFDLIKTDRNWTELEATEINTLLLVAEDAEGRAGIRAQNTLSFHYGFDYFRDAILPEFSAQENAEEASSKFDDIASIVLWNAYPNPATNEVVIEYSLPNEAKNPVLLIHDSDGRVVFQQNLDPKNTQYIWETTSLGKGVYFYTLKYDDRMQQTKQVLLMK